MKLAVNFSSVLLALINDQPNLAVDYIKVPTIPFPYCWDQFEQGERIRRLLPHPAQPGVIALGHPEEKNRFNGGLITEIMERTGFPYLSTHMEARVEYFTELQEYQHETCPRVAQALQRRFLKGINEARQIGLPIIIENFPYYAGWRHFRVASDPEYISELCLAGECDFLLDIAHARCTAWSIQMETKEYLKRLPLARTREIHLAGVLQRSEGIRDAHLPMVEEDYQLFEYILGRTDPEVVTIEYGGLADRITGLNGEEEEIFRNDPDELLAMIERVNRIIR